MVDFLKKKLFWLWFLAMIPSAFSTPINSSCSATILNQTTRVNDDGSFEINNISVGIGEAQVRVSCETFPNKFHHQRPLENEVDSDGMHCFVAGTKILKSNGEYQSIENIQIGEKVSSELDSAITTQVDSTYLEIELQAFTLQGDTLTTKLIRSPDWLSQNGIVVGKPFYLSLNEMNYHEWVTVVYVKPVNLSNESGALVTGTFQNVSSDVWRLEFSLSDQLILTTGLHKFYSLDRNYWVRARNIREGERLKTYFGEAVLERKIKEPGTHRIYNFEVDQTHTYYVGEGRLYVHNQCQGEQGFVDLTGNRKKHILDGDRKGGGHRNGTGKPGKSEIPEDWSDDKILHEISDVATDPNSKVSSGKWGEDIFKGTRDGVDIQVDMFPSNSRNHGNISTGYPTNIPKNPEGEL